MTKDDEEEGWWPHFVEPPPGVLGEEYMEMELRITAPKVKIVDGDVVHYAVTYIAYGDVKFRPERPCHMTIRFVHSPIGD